MQRHCCCYCCLPSWWCCRIYPISILMFKKCARLNKRYTKRKENSLVSWHRYIIIDNIVPSNGWEKKSFLLPEYITDCIIDDAPDVIQALFFIIYIFHMLLLPSFLCFQFSHLVARHISYKFERKMLMKENVIRIKCFEIFATIVNTYRQS